MESALTAPIVTLEIRRMQEALYGSSARGGIPVSDTAVWQMLEALRKAEALVSFRIWLVGSRLEANEVESDVDLVLSPRMGTRPTDRQVERALWSCRHYGIEAMDPICIVDPCFRLAGPTLNVVNLPADAIVSTTKLLSPGCWRDVSEGRIRRYRLSGRFSVEFSRPAAETTYYAKLPVFIRDGVISRYLRPAVEVT